MEVTVIAMVPVTPSTVALMGASPALTPVTIPDSDTVATAVLALAHSTARSSSESPSASSATARSCSLSPTAIEVAGALTVTWALNRTWTFETGRARTPGSQYRRYIAVQIAGFAINYATFAVLVTGSPALRALPLAALVAGALVSMVNTYALSRALVFAANPQLAAEGPSPAPLMRALGTEP